MNVNDFPFQPDLTPDQVRAIEIDDLRIKLQRVQRRHRPSQAGALACHLQAIRLLDSVSDLTPEENA
jgi:hypothetical protein